MQPSGFNQAPYGTSVGQCYAHVTIHIDVVMDNPKKMHPPFGRGCGFRLGVNLSSKTRLPEGIACCAKYHVISGAASVILGYEK